MIERLDLSPDYSQDHKSIRSLQDFIRFAETLKDSHIEKRSKRGQEQLLRKIAAFDTFSRNYSSVADAISSIEPYGGAGALWSCLSVTLTVSDFAFALPHHFMTGLNYLIGADDL